MSCPWVWPVCKSTIHPEPPRSVTVWRQAQPRKILITLILAAAMYLAASGFTPVVSERLYYCWPPALFACWLLWRTPQRLALRQQATLAIVGMTLGAIAALDFKAGVTAFQRGEITRAAYCLLGFLLFMEVVRQALSLLRCRLLPTWAASARRRPLPAMLVWILFYAAVSYPYLVSYMQIHPLKRRDESNPQRALNLAYESASWRSADGTMLRGWYVPAEESNRTAIVCHGVMDSKSGMMGFVAALHQGGYNILVPDMRRRGLCDSDIAFSRAMPRLGDGVGWWNRDSW